MPCTAIYERMISLAPLFLFTQATVIVCALQAVDSASRAIKISGSIGSGFASKEDVKGIIAGGAVVLALAGLCVLAAAQGVLHSKSASAPTVTWLGNAQSNPIVIASQAGDWPAPVLPPAHKPEFKIQTLPPTAHLRSPPAPPGIAPGIYKTAPYTCIVVVPGPCPDDSAIVSPHGKKYSMPIIKPELRFIPLGPAKK
jgi:hypothetical protein